MYLQEIFAENFRIFGIGEGALDLPLRPGLNVLIGENDAGKSAVVDAIRLCLGTTARDQPRVTLDDFHIGDKSRSTSLVLRCKFAFDDDAEIGLFLEYLTAESLRPVLYVRLEATRAEDEAKSLRRNGISVEITTGPDGSGPRMDAVVRQKLATTFLKALRDAASELSSGRGSRLSQILSSHKNFQGQEVDDFDSADPTQMPTTLVGIMRRAEASIEGNAVVTDTQRTLNDEYLKHFTIANAALEGHVGMAKAELRHILEKLDLWIENPTMAERTLRGLGSMNILFMASELLLLRQNEDIGVPLLLIEEPEAHLHPQLQLLVSQYLSSNAESRETSRMQVIITTHSPTLGSKLPLDSITLLSNGNAYPLGHGLTRLEADDYRYLERFMDATKANLFFAKGVVIVEGDAENILLPTLAELLDRSFTKHGVSIVKVGSTGLFRYSRIFRRPADKDGNEPMVPIPVACISDRDIKEHEPPADAVEKKVAALIENDGGSVQTYISEYRTLETDLTLRGLAEFVHSAIYLATKSKSRKRALSDDEQKHLLQEAKSAFVELQKSHQDAKHLADAIYEPLGKHNASKAETAQFLSEILEGQFAAHAMDADELRPMVPEYLLNAIAHVTAPF
uniref:SMC (Structural maintenance of chromosomes) family protein n=1 Tax=mine drainage metagenome TaxID=410659 RepID=E6QHA7_9ZZZZ